MFAGPCSMNLKNFPMDVQQCFLTFESFNYNTEEVQMNWFVVEPILILKDKIELPDFTLIQSDPSRLVVVKNAIIRLPVVIVQRCCDFLML